MPKTNWWEISKFVVPFIVTGLIYAGVAWAGVIGNREQVKTLCTKVEKLEASQAQLLVLTQKVEDLSRNADQAYRDNRKDHENIESTLKELLKRH
jgi:outer membrane murein-binding lipoprotein Lpp